MLQGTKLKTLEKYFASRNCGTRMNWHEYYAKWITSNIEIGFSNFTTPRVKINLTEHKLAAT